MAKMGFGLGGGPRPTGHMGGMTRPMPNPRLNVPAAQPVQPAKPAQPGGFFGARGSQERHDMTMKFLEMAMQSAQGSTNPFISALTPIASALVGARNEKIRGDARDAEVSGMTDALLGPGGMSPDAKQALDILNNENAPSYLKAIAQKKFDAAMAPIMGAGGGSGGGHKRRSRSSGGGGSTKTPRLYGAVVNDANGRPGRYDGHGQWWPLIGPDGGAAPGPAPLDVAMAPIAPPDPVLPKDPTSGASLGGGLTDDELLLKYGG